jgi:hypothetical protein
MLIQTSLLLKNKIITCILGAVFEAQAETKSKKN